MNIAEVVNYGSGQSQIMKKDSPWKVLEGGIWEHIYSYLLDVSNYKLTLVNKFTYDLIHSSLRNDPCKTSRVFFEKIVHALNKNTPIPRQNLIAGGGRDYGVLGTAANASVIVVVDSDFITFFNPKNLKPLFFFPKPEKIKEVHAAALSDRYLVIFASHFSKAGYKRSRLYVWNVMKDNQQWNVNVAAESLHVQREPYSFYDKSQIYIYGDKAACVVGYERCDVEIFNLKKLDEKSILIEHKTQNNKTNINSFSVNFDGNWVYYQPYTGAHSRNIYKIDINHPEKDPILIGTGESYIAPLGYTTSKEHNILLKLKREDLKVSLTAFPLNNLTKEQWKITVRDQREVADDNYWSHCSNGSLAVHGDVALIQLKHDSFNKKFLNKIAVYLINIKDGTQLNAIERTQISQPFLFDETLFKEYGLLVDYKQEQGLSNLLGFYGVKGITHWDRARQVVPLAHSFGCFIAETILKVVGQITGLMIPFFCHIAFRHRQVFPTIDHRRILKYASLVGEGVILVSFAGSIFWKNEIMIAVCLLGSVYAIFFRSAVAYHNNLMPRFKGDLKILLNLFIATVLFPLHYALRNNQTLNNLRERFNPIRNYQDWRSDKIKESYFAVQRASVLTEEQKKKLENSGCLHLCGLMRKPIRNPVTLNGVLYERSAIELYLKYYGIVPLTQKVATPQDLIVDTALASKIQAALR